MSVDEAAAAALSKIALAADGAVLGAVLAYVAIRSILNFASYSSALRRIKDAPSLRISDLRSILSDSDHDSGDRKLVAVRGYVEAKSAVEGNWTTLRPSSAIVSPHSGDKAVILLRTQTSIYNEWRGLFGWTSEVRSVFTRSWKEQESSSLRTIPFVLVDGGWPYSDYAVVNMNGSRHPLPLVTVHHHLQPITASPYTVLQAFFGHEYPVGLLEEEKILPLGKDITVVGMCGLSNKTLEIKSCKDLPFFMSDMTKEQMLVDLAFRTKVVLWSGVVLGSLAIGVLGYAAVRNWNKWKEWRQMRRIQRDNADDSSEADTQIVRDEESGDIPEGEVCVICLARRRRSAFIPCGHLVCCPQCALFLEREVSPKCPVCRQSIRTSVRIYDS